MILTFLKRKDTRRNRQLAAQRIVNSLRAFSKDRSGSFAVAFAGSLMALLICAGAAIDTSRYYMLKKAAYNAADSAILAVAARTDLKTAAEKEAYAQSIFDLQFSSRYSDISNTDITLSEPPGSPRTVITGAPLYNTVLMDLFGIKTLPIRFTSETTHQNLEVVLVLDNSGSLSKAELLTMENAATQLIDAAFDSAPAGQSVQIGVVPFSATVNIGELTSQQKQDWIDGGGARDPESTYHGHWYLHAERNSNGDVVVDPLKRVNHLDLFKSINSPKHDWAGCVQARPSPYDLRDTPPTNSQTRWVPHFWPDAPECRKQNHTTSTDKAACEQDSSNPSGDPNSLGKVVSERNGQDTDNHNFVWDRTYIAEDPKAKALYQEYIDAIKASKKSKASAWKKRFDQGPLMVAGPLTENATRLGYVGVWDSTKKRYIGKYEHANTTITEANGNRGCGAPLTPLTNNKDAVGAGLKAMAANHNGGTSIPTGVMWGLRVLSPGEPFTQGAPYTDGSTRKVMVLMSDGGNWYTGGVIDELYVKSELGAYGFIGADRLSGVLQWPGNKLSKAVKVLDGKTEEACNLAKSNGVEIYTITLGDKPTLPTPNDLMEKCATSSEYTHAATLHNSDTLDRAFRDIASDLIAPYLSK